jgi:hypothetical protein
MQQSEHAFWGRNPNDTVYARQWDSADIPFVSAQATAVSSEQKQPMFHFSLTQQDTVHDQQYGRFFMEQSCSAVPVERTNIKHIDWHVFILGWVMIFFCLFKLYFPRLYRYLHHILFKKHSDIQTMQLVAVSSSFVRGMLSVTSCLGFVLVIHSFLRSFDVGIPYGRYFLLIIIIISFLYGWFRRTFLRTTGWMIDVKENIPQYYADLLCLDFAAMMYMQPVMILNYCQPSPIWLLGIAWFFGAFALQRLWVTWKHLQEKLTLYHVFLYLCIFELMPTVIFIRFIGGDVPKYLEYFKNYIVTVYG